MEGLDWLLRLATPRYLLLAVLLAGAMNLGMRYQEVPRRMYREWRYPPQNQPVDVDLAAEMKKGGALRVQALYRKVSALIEEARGNGFSVDGLQAKANAALDLEKAGFREPALQVLAEVEMQIPRKKVQYIPMDEPQTDPDLESPDLLPSQLPARGSAPSQRGSGKASRAGGKKARRRRRTDE